VFGSMAAFVAGVTASLLTPAPSRDTVETITAIRLPRGEIVLQERLV
jgi:hypothetical protein